jgi:hypothetical protein
MACAFIAATKYSPNKSSIFGSLSSTVQISQAQTDQLKAFLTEWI